MARGWFSIRWLRVVLVLAALGLMGVVAGYIGYARLLKGKFKLPGTIKLGNFEIETDGLTYSPTDGTRKICTIHASRQVKHRNGLITLRDVGIELYGKSGDRSDHVHGDEFEWDPKNQVISAVGTVYLDIAPPGKAKGSTTPAQEEARIIHMKTDGLMYRQKEGTAETDKEIEFRSGGMSGTAVGASYDSDGGAMVLWSEVRISGLRGHEGSERPMVLTASHAELDTKGNVARLEGARLVTATERGSETAEGQHAVVHLTADGTPERVEANGNVRLRGDGRGMVTADRMEMDINPAGQPKAAHLAGGVRFAKDEPAKSENGRANDARVAFDAEGRPVHALMTGAVEAEVKEGVAERWLDADKLELALAGGGKAPIEVRAAQATGAGGAKMRLVDAVVKKDSKGKVIDGLQRTSVTGDVLTARFVPGVAKTEVAGVDGAGHTVVDRRLENGSGAGAGTLWHESGNGDTLRLDFTEAAAVKGKARRQELARAEQRGSVKIVREAQGTGKKAGTVEVEHAEADDATYDAAADRMALVGGAKIADAESAVYADRVDVDRASGDATAEGSVRVSYVQAGGAGEPMHVLSARAVAHKASGVTQFFAPAGGMAKMWQGGSQVEAPVIDFDRTKRTVLAHGSGSQTVRTVLVNGDTEAKAKPGPAGGKKPAGPVRVSSRELLYTDVTREAVFRGAVVVNDADGVMRAEDATVFLSPKEAAVAAGSAGADDSKGATAAVSLAGKVDHIVATGGVNIEQPGRKATGEKLVYTEADRTFVLTGTRAAAPRVVDEAQGTTTGAQLRFHTGDDSVEVLGGGGADRVHSETRLKGKE